MSIIWLLCNDVCLDSDEFAHSLTKPLAPVTANADGTVSDAPPASSAPAVEPKTQPQQDEHEILFDSDDGTTSSDWNSSEDDDDFTPVVASPKRLSRAASRKRSRKSIPSGSQSTIVPPPPTNSSTDEFAPVHTAPEPASRDPAPAPKAEYQGLYSPQTESKDDDVVDFT